MKKLLMVMLALSVADAFSTFEARCYDYLITSDEEAQAQDELERIAALFDADLYEKSVFFERQKDRSTQTDPCSVVRVPMASAAGANG